MFDLLPGSLAGILCSVMQEAWIWSLTLVTVLLGVHCYKNKSISLQPYCCVLCSGQISHVQQGQPCSGLTELGVLWGFGKEPQNKRMCVKCCPCLCSTPGSFYSLVVYFLLPLFPHTYHYFKNMHFCLFLSQQRQLLWVCRTVWMQC